MKVQAISNNQNFEGKIVTIGKFSRQNMQIIDKAKKVLSDRVTFAPFDVYIKEGEMRNIIMSYTKDFNKQYPVNSFSNRTGKPRVFDYARIYETMRNEIAENIKKENFWEKFKYFIGIKKYVG